MCFWLKTKQEAKSHSSEGWENQPHHAQSLSTPLPPSLRDAEGTAPEKMRAQGCSVPPNARNTGWLQRQPASRSYSCMPDKAQVAEVLGSDIHLAVRCGHKKLALKNDETSQTGRKRQDASNRISPLIHDNWKSDLLTKALRFQRNCNNCGRTCKLLYLIFLSLWLPPKKACQIAHSFHYHTNSYYFV